MKEKKARVIALYLPQFHPIPENDEWWGKGFTEWTNVAKAKPLFKGHYQPRIPADLGFYDLRLPEVREQQAQMAKDAGIEGFCYWHYWFGKGKRLLERPFNEVLASGKPDFPFCLGWANETWSNKSWKDKGGRKDAILMEQTYVESEYVDHFYDVLPAIKDHRYITVDGKPLFVVFNPYAIPNPNTFIDCWQKLARENGLDGIHFVGITFNLMSVKIEAGDRKKYYYAKTDESASRLFNQVLGYGFNAVNSRGQYRAELIEQGHFKRAIIVGLNKLFGIRLLTKFNYKDMIKHLFVPEDKWENVYPTVLPNWDRSPRSGKEAFIYYNSTPELFRKHFKDALDLVKDKAPEHKILFLKSWNEWGEGNYVEPDLKYGHQYLDVIKEELSK